jgi:hypothetical protein
MIGHHPKVGGYSNNQATKGKPYVVSGETAVLAESNA